MSWVKVLDLSVMVLQMVGAGSLNYFLMEANGA